VSTNRGTLLNLHLTPLLSAHFALKEPTTPRESVNILRNQREEFENCFSQRGHTQQFRDLPSEERGEGLIELQWVRKVSDQLGALCRLGVKEDAVGVLCQDYSKVVNTNLGDIEASLNISKALPLKWTRLRDSHSELKKEVYETLKILDAILRNNGYEMLAKEYRLINVTPFMEMMKMNLLIPSKSQKKISPTETPILTDSHTLQAPKEEPTLKSLEAYKRVTAIKKLSEESMRVPSTNREEQQAQFERDGLVQMLSNINYKDLISRYNIERDPQLNSLSNRL
jgi:hypothetical protein